MRNYTIPKLEIVIFEADLIQTSKDNTFVNPWEEEQ